jgi:hypothetical protein
MPRNILIDPQRTGTSNPSIQFSGSAANTIKLEVLPSGSVQFTGVSGSLFSIVDSLSGSLFAVSDVSGLPILEVFSDDTVIAGRYNSNALVVTGSQVGIGAYPTGRGSDVFFYVSGSVSRVAVFGGDVYSSGTIRASAFTGSLTQLLSGLPYIIGAGSVTVTTNSSGQIVITGSASSAAGEVSASYLVLSATSSLANERVFTAGTGLTSSDGGAGGSYTLSVRNDVVATLTGSVFTGPVFASGGLTGSLQMVGPNLPYLVAGTNVSIVTGANGQVTISSTAPAPGAAGEVSASYVVLSATSSLANERVLTAGSGISITDNGPGNSVVISSTVTGSGGGGTGGGVAGTYVLTFTSSSLVSNRLSVTHSLGGQYLNVSVYDDTNSMVIPDSIVADNSNTVTIGFATIVSRMTGSWNVFVANGTQPSELSASYLVLSATSSLANERVLTMGTGLTSSDGGSGGSYTLSIVNSVVATVSGTTFTGPVSASGGLSGSLQLVTPGVPYLVGQGTVTVTTSSNGQVVITGTGGPGGGPTILPIVEGYQASTLTGYFSIGAVSLDVTSSYPGMGVTFQAIVQNSDPTHIAYVRFYNVTDATQVVELNNSSSISRTTPTKLTSSLLAIPSGEKMYEVQIKLDTSTGDAVICKSAQLTIS